MTAGLPQAPSQENVSTTLNGGITDVATTITVADASKLQSPTYLVIDRVDSAGTQNETTQWEYVKVTNIAGNDLTVTRAQGGSTGQAHSSGAVVEAVMTADHWQDIYAALNPEHTASGGHVITGTATISNIDGGGISLNSMASIAKANFITLSATSIASIARIEGVDLVLSGTASIATLAGNLGITGQGFKKATGNTDIGSSSYAVLTGTQVVTTPSSDSWVKIDSHIGYETGAAITTDQFQFGIFVGDTAIATSVKIGPNSANERLTVSLTGLTTVASGAATISLQAKRNTGSATINIPANDCMFTYMTWNQ